MLERLGSSAVVMLLGLLVVFTGLVILIACIVILGKILNKKQKSQESLTKAVENAGSDAPGAAKLVSTPSAAIESGIPNDVIAVITAAIMAMEGSNKGLVVRSIKRARNASSWADAGRQEQMIF